MPIPNANLPVVILLSELELQCKVILRAGKRLREAAAHWKALDRGIDDGKNAAPIDIVGDCALCLSAASAISRLLFVGERQGKRSVLVSKRSRTLMHLLGEPTLRAVEALAVRNSWEHLDERLDKVLTCSSYSSYSDVHVSAQTPDPGTFVNRHFDPVKLEIGHGSDSIALQPLLDDCNQLSSRISSAFHTLQIELHEPY